LLLSQNVDVFEAVSAKFSKQNPLSPSGLLIRKTILLPQIGFLTSDYIMAKILRTLYVR